jgi:hypothetical protein
MADDMEKLEALEGFVNQVIISWWHLVS